MALFFDAAWFDARLEAVGLSRETLAAALGLSQDEIADLWKDQRQLSLQDVRVIAGLICAAVEEVALHAGVSTPMPKPADDIETRLTRVERELEDIKRLLAERKARR